MAIALTVATTMVGNGMLKIDIHTHILPPEIPRFKDRFGYGGFMQLHHQDACHAHMVDDSGKFFRQVKANCYNAQARLEDCAQSGVDVQVLSVVPALFSYFARPQDGCYVSQFINDHIQQVVENHPQRFVGLGTLPMQDPALAVKELERCQKIGLKGVEIGSHIKGKNLSDQTFFPLYEACQQLGMALFVHPWEMMGTETMPDYWLPWLVGMPAETSRAICSMIFGGVFERFKHLRVAFAHGGGAFPATVDRIQHGFQVRPDLCAQDNAIAPRDYLGQFYVDSLVHGEDMLRHIVHLLGVHRVALGSDYPFPLGESSPGTLIEQCAFSPQERAWLWGKTALSWLNMQEQDFRR